MSDAAIASTPQIFSGKLHRIRRGHGIAFSEAAPKPPETVRRPARIAVMIALAHKIQNAIDRCVVRDRAEVARRLGLTRARVTQLLDMTLLAPDLQRQFLVHNLQHGRKRGNVTQNLIALLGVSCTAQGVEDDPSNSIRFMRYQRRQPNG